MRKPLVPSLRRILSLPSAEPSRAWDDSERLRLSGQIIAMQAIIAFVVLLRFLGETLGYAMWVGEVPSSNFAGVGLSAFFIAGLAWTRWRLATRRALAHLSAAALLAMWAVFSTMCDLARRHYRCWSVAALVHDPAWRAGLLLRIVPVAWAIGALLSLKGCDTDDGEPQGIRPDRWSAFALVFLSACAIPLPLMEA